ncbi:ABC transporter permease [Gordonia soli]|uniref:Putative dipeptide ABC transporter permease protein n=1 Tax=Gordonia soli NBRC 108243 TaxID=1223545 RepID=M0QPJ0_9ACTN|nr:ABC transporter permease [Gordonia soli]GAC70478.1 putative dipeptide ABC transporter permease protein [Gordonia soli NBRC 108243]
MTIHDDQATSEATDLEPTSPSDDAPSRPAAPLAARHRRTRLHRPAWTHHHQLVAAVTVLALVIVVSVLAPLIAPHDPTVGDAASRYLEPGSAGHLLGTDEQGRDILSRLIWGGRATIAPTALATTVAVLIGSVVGLLAGWSRSWISSGVMRIVDILFAFPVVIVAFALAEVIGMGVWVVAAAVIFAATPYVTRIVYAETRRQRELEYVEAAVGLGGSSWTILRTEILPNVGATVIVYWTSLIGILIVLASSLSALGIGVQPPTPDWGRMVAEGAKVLISGSPYVAIAPGIAILVVGLAFNWLGDGLRDVLDPRWSAHR